MRTGDGVSGTGGPRFEVQRGHQPAWPTECQTRLRQGNDRHALPVRRVRLPLYKTVTPSTAAKRSFRKNPLREDVFISYTLRGRPEKAAAGGGESDENRH